MLINVYILFVFIFKVGQHVHLKQDLFVTICKIKLMISTGRGSLDQQAPQIQDPQQITHMAPDKVKKFRFLSIGITLPNEVLFLKGIYLFHCTCESCMIML